MISTMLIGTARFIGLIRSSGAWVDLLYSFFLCDQVWRGIDVDHSICLPSFSFSFLLFIEYVWGSGRIGSSLPSFTEFQLSFQLWSHLHTTKSFLKWYSLFLRTQPSNRWNSQLRKSSSITTSLTSFSKKQRYDYCENTVQRFFLHSHRWFTRSNRIPANYCGFASVGTRFFFFTEFYRVSPTTAGEGVEKKQTADGNVLMRIHPFLCLSLSLSLSLATYLSREEERKKERKQGKETRKRISMISMMRVDWRGHATCRFAFVDDIRCHRAVVKREASSSTKASSAVSHTGGAACHWRVRRRPMAAAGSGGADRPADQVRNEKDPLLRPLLQTNTHTQKSLNYRPRLTAPWPTMWISRVAALFFCDPRVRWFSGLTGAKQWPGRRQMMAAFGRWRTAPSRGWAYQPTTTIIMMMTMMMMMMTSARWVG